MLVDCINSRTNTNKTKAVEVSVMVAVVLNNREGPGFGGTFGYNQKFFYSTLRCSEFGIKGKALVPCRTVQESEQFRRNSPSHRNQPESVTVNGSSDWLISARLY